VQHFLYLMFSYDVVSRCTSFTKTLLFCTNFLRKMTKIRISDKQHVLLFYVQHFHHMENPLHTTKLLTMLTYTIATFKLNCFTKTLFFCANFLRKMTKIKISDQHCVLPFYVQHFRHM
jgi:hypothetical protein